MNSQNKSSLIFWVVTAIMLFTFFPAGIIMLIWKIVKLQRDYVQKGRVFLILGCICEVIALAYLLSGIAVFAESMFETEVIVAIAIMLVLAGGGGAVLLFKARGYIKKGKKYERYLSIINSSRDGLIDYIASAYPTTYDVAVEDLRSMINDGFLENTYIDLRRRALVTPGSGVPEPNTAYARDVVCKRCGGVNKVTPGTTTPCEYCGSPIIISAGTQPNPAKTAPTQQPQQQRPFTTQLTLNGCSSKVIIALVIVIFVFPICWAILRTILSISFALFFH